MTKSGFFKPERRLFLPAGSQISCFTPSNFTAQQSGFVDAACWDSLLHHGLDARGRVVTKSLWALKVWGQVRGREPRLAEAKVSQRPFPLVFFSFPPPRCSPTRCWRWRG